MEHDHFTNSQSHFISRINAKFGGNWLFLKNHDFIHVNSTVAGKYNKHKQDGSHLGFPLRIILATVGLQVTSILPMNFESTALSVQEKKFKIYFQDGRHGRNLEFPVGTI